LSPVDTDANADADVDTSPKGRLRRTAVEAMIRPSTLNLLAIDRLARSVGLRITRTATQRREALLA
jgi:hypothetical protein